MSEIGIIHSDLKPENILINKVLPHVKVIDLGSAVRVTNNNPNNKQIYMQSRYYRAPEMLLGKTFDCGIDIWSVGCIAAELFLGHPLFPGNSEYDQIKRITQMFGPFPQPLIQGGGNRSRNFVEEGVNNYRLMTPEEKSKISGNIEPQKRYSHIKATLSDTLTNHAKGQFKDVEIQQFTHFLKFLLEIDPAERITAWQALHHPFITNRPYDETWKPPPQYTHNMYISPVFNVIGNQQPK